MAVGAARERCGKLGAEVVEKFTREVVSALRCARPPRVPFGVNQRGDLWGDHATCSCALSQLWSGGSDLGAFWAERPVALSLDGAFGCIPRALLREVGLGPWLVPSQRVSRPGAMKLSWGLPLGAFA